MVSGLVGIDSLLAQEAVGATELAVRVVYDGDGNRISETVGGTTTKFLVDDHTPTGLPQAMDELVNGAVTRTCTCGWQRIRENQLIDEQRWCHHGHLHLRRLRDADHHEQHYAEQLPLQYYSTSGL